VDGNDIETRATTFATAKHAGQTRKYNPNVPYVTHPLKVAEMLREIRNDSDLVAVALLHDVVEDTDTSLYEIKIHFGKRVASLVAELTSDKGFKINWAKQSTSLRKFCR